MWSRSGDESPTQRPRTFALGRSASLRGISALTALALGGTLAWTVMAGATDPKVASFGPTSFDFGRLVLGQESAVMTSSFPLATTLGAQRSLIESVINSQNTVIPDVVFDGFVVLTGAQVKAAAIAALDGLPDSTVLAVKVGRDQNGQRGRLRAVWELPRC